MVCRYKVLLANDSAAMTATIIRDPSYHGHFCGSNYRGGRGRIEWIPAAKAERSRNQKPEELILSCLGFFLEDAHTESGRGQVTAVSLLPFSTNRASSGH